MGACVPPEMSIQDIVSATEKQDGFMQKLFNRQTFRMLCWRQQPLQILFALTPILRSLQL